MSTSTKSTPDKKASVAKATEANKQAASTTAAIKSQTVTKSTAAKVKPTKATSPVIDQLITAIGKLTILELNQLVETLQTEFNITPMTPGAATATASETTSNEVSVILTEIGDNKIAVIKALNAILKKGLMEAKKMLDKLPLTVVDKRPLAEANEIKAELEKVGATIVVK